MDKDLDSHISYGTDTAATLPSDRVSYGAATGLDAASAQAAPAASFQLFELLKYFYCEHLRGVLFVSLSLLFVFVIPVALVRPARMKAIVNRVVKRSVDLLGAVLGLILTLPSFIIIPILIKLDSSGPVFYTQVRIGVNRRTRERRYCQHVDVPDHRCRDRRCQDLMGKPFRVIKFRTMVQNAEKKCGPVWATENDPRVTPIGRILRKTRLDEIPQFINVLKGDMSLVGPRPERPNFVKDLAAKVHDYNGRLTVKPGLTGLAQVQNGYDTSVASVTQKVRLDLEYIRDWSLWADFKILVKTVVVVLTGRGAY